MVRTVLVVGLLVCGVANGDDEVKLSPRHVSVTGTTVARAQPDMVVWNITVRRHNRELAKAQADCDEGVKKVLALRGQLKVKPQDAQTGYLSVQKIYDRDQHGNQTSFRHFEVVRTVTLRQQDTTRFDEILAQLIGAEDVEVSYHLESSDYHKLRAQTRLEAVRAARDKAQAMTELLGGKLGRVLRIAEPRENWGSSLGVSNNAAFYSPRQAEPDEAPGTFSPGSVEVRVSIEVDFEIE
jgi:uncharacterized protein YggE